NLGRRRPGGDDPCLVLRMECPCPAWSLGLIIRQAAQFAPTLIDEQVPAGRVGLEDADWRHADERAETTLTGLERRIDSLAFGDVGRHADDTDDRALYVPERTVPGIVNGIADLNDGGYV